MLLMGKILCDGWNTDIEHAPVATHRIGVDGEKWRVCEDCYDRIIADAEKGLVVLWDCN